ncbi:integrase catalytic domain-containing protein [Trichonephila clavipes]|nr:integrase catalytic domain-containing protein [Trichonephila clavipes]
MCIGRCIVHPQETRVELHGFADASEKCYGAVIHCRSQSPDDATTVKLVTKMNPPVYLWSDSTIFLAWIKKEPNLCVCVLKTFVANRVATIQHLTNAELWHHVSSEQNQADFVSKGFDPSSLYNNSLWWNGPTFLTTKDFPERNILSSVTDSDEFKAVHFELVSDLTTQAFIASLKRFIARRGRSSLLFSDNGKTFIGANDEFKVSRGTSPLKRLNALWTRLIRDPQYLKLYRDFIHEYDQLGHMKEVVAEHDNSEVAYYMPHHGVLRPEKSTTKLRVVFNATNPTSNGLSLNSIQYNGGLVQNYLFTIMIKFREHPYAFTADVKMMYRMILIHESQQPLFRILWKESPEDPVKTFEMKTVTYGTVSAPF